MNACNDYIFDCRLFTGGFMAQCSGVAEPDEPYRPTISGDQPSEHLLHLLWQRQDFLSQPLMALDQQAVTIYRPGRWSRGSGPDFLDAKLRLGDDPIRVGAVEVHVQASDWFRHGHDQDPAYAKVLLHVVWHNDLGARELVDVNGREIPQLALSEALVTSLAEVQSLLEDERLPTGHGAMLTPCQQSLLEMSAETIGHVLDMAGEERWRQKANRIALRVERRGIEQALYETLMESLGFQGNRMPFWQLAQISPGGTYPRGTRHCSADPDPCAGYSVWRVGIPATAGKRSGAPSHQTARPMLRRSQPTGNPWHRCFPSVSTSVSGARRASARRISRSAAWRQPGIYSPA